MRDFIVLIAICLLLVLVGAAFLFPGQLFSFLSARAGTVRRPLEAPQPKPEPQPKSTAKTLVRKLASRAPRREQPPQLTEPVPVLDPLPVFKTSVPAEPVTVGPLRIPGLEEVKIGSSGFELLASFGTPAVSVSTEDRGHLYETYVYRSEGRSTVIYLSDRKVSSVRLGQADGVGSYFGAQTHAPAMKSSAPQAIVTP